MARMIQFCQKQVYQGPAGGDNISEIFDVSDIQRLDIEFRIFATSSGGQVHTGQIQTTSDPTFMESSWQPVPTTPSSLTLTTTGIITGVASGLGRFARARLVVSSGVYITACINAVGREP